MKNRKLIFLLLMSIGFFSHSFAQNEQQKKANELYSKGDYIGASGFTRPSSKHTELHLNCIIT